MTSARETLRDAARRRIAIVSLVILALADVASAAGSQVVAKKAALSTTSPQATQIGLAIMQRGGNAIDAAVAVSFALAVAHPQAGNLGGGGFLVYYDAATKGVWTLDFRETAPLQAKRDMFKQGADGVSVNSRVGPLSACVPATVAGLAAAHGRFGSRPWKELVDPASHLAREGVKVDARLSGDLDDANRERNISQYPSTRSIFFPNGKPLAAGATLVQTDLGLALERLAVKGPEDFYEGELAERMINATRESGGIVGFRDLREYKPLWRAPIRIAFRDYQLYTVAPPAAGGITIGEALNILGGYDLAQSGFETPRTIHLIAEAERRAGIDRLRYLGDPATERIPYRELLSVERAKQWRASIGDRATPTISLTAPITGAAESTHTTHVTIVDPQGNIVSLTTTLGDNFGSGYVVPGLGFFLNNAMKDFNLAPGAPSNALDAAKRPASSLAPLLIMRNEKPLVAMGTRGGTAIPGVLLEVFLNMAVWNKSLADAIAAPRFVHSGIPEDLVIERGRSNDATVQSLLAMAHGVRDEGAVGEVHAVLIDRDRLVAIADPRSNGAAGGY